MKIKDITILVCFFIILLFFISNAQYTTRMCAEWEPAFGTLIRWPLGIPKDLVVELAKDDTLYTTVSSQSQEDDARSKYSSWGVNLDHCVFIKTKTNTHWTRDWGPHLTFDEKGVGGILDPIFKGYPHVNGCEFGCSPSNEESMVDQFYYRSSLNDGYEDDDKASSFFAKQQNWPHRNLPTYLTGGNVMVDGINTAISTELMIDENSSICNEAEFKKHAKEHLGITNFNIVKNPEIRGIQHIDCYAKYLDEETILLKEVSKDNPEYKCVERLYDELKALKSCYGRPYKIVRIVCGPYKNSDVAAYTNSLILNKKVLVPLFDISTDEGALATFRKAMPGYEVIGIKYPNKWYYYDALHCRTMAIFDRFMLRISHRPLDEEIKATSTIKINAFIDDRSNAGLIEKECLVYWRKKGASDWSTAPFKQISGVDSFAAEIPAQNSGINIEYYLSAEDSSGRKELLPRSAPDWFYSFKVAEGTHKNPDNKAIGNNLIRFIFTENNNSHLQFSFSEKLPVTIYITNLLGKRICTLLKNTIPRGTIYWDGRNYLGNPCSPGIYFMVMKGRNTLIVKSFVILK